LNIQETEIQEIEGRGTEVWEIEDREIEIWEIKFGIFINRYPFLLNMDLVPT